ncbi:unnamed protein product [Cylindrotheca closterium]|uniref:Uncharacterized protein n=1 Tax=Cylindrotheca closterium TaxID=2856 RepID=A0AAD2G050_9STRA|nr:unnamed protein product [Cylindrotheca closterium]
MATTRRSKRIESKSAREEHVEVENVVTATTNEDDDDDDDEAPEEVSTPEPGKNSKKKQTAKARKQQKKEAMKSKATGVGLKISIEAAATKNKKIVFGDDEDVEDEPVEEEGEPENDDNEEESDDDDDDAIEEVTGSKAREDILEQLNVEEKLATKSKKKRKKRERKQVEDEEGESDDEFDEAFFAELEAAKAEEQRELAKTKRKGKHTTFVVSHDEDDMDDTPREVDDNIQVVVLKNPLQDSTANAIAAVPTNKLSQQATMFSRGSLDNGSDGVARGATGKKRKWQVDNTWKRSKKMKNMVRVNRGGRGGKNKSLAPTIFVTK